MERKLIIYKITDLSNGMLYIGQTTQSLNERMNQHKCDDLYIDRIMRKHGWKNFKVDVIEECETVEELNEREKYWIKALNSKKPNGYNLTDGGNNSTHSDEQKAKISAGLKNYYSNPEAIAKLTEARRKHTVSKKKSVFQYKKVKDKF